MKNKVEWQDIVRINDEYYLERHDVEFEYEFAQLDDVYLGDDEGSIINKIMELSDEFDKGEFPLYDCSDFFGSITEKYRLDDDDDIETYLFDDIDLPEEVTKKFDIAWCGGYINGVNI